LGDPPAASYIVTDLPRNFDAVAERFLGARVQTAEQVDLQF
jgi:hypothetical protein